MINAFWSVVGYLVAAGVTVIPIVGLWLFTRTRRWQRRHRIRWAGSEMPLLWWRGIDRDIAPELLDPPGTKYPRS